MNIRYRRFQKVNVTLYQSTQAYQNYETDKKAWILQWKENFKKTPRSELSRHVAISNEHIKNTEIVLAWYDENIDWVDEFPDANFKVYNKGQPFDREINSNVSIAQLPNKGREGGTFVDYILQRYDTLPDYVLFSQADPSDHVPYYFDQVKAVLDGKCSSNDGYLLIGKLCVCPSWMVDVPIHGIYAMYYTLFAEVWNYDHYFPWGATLRGKKETIRKRPLAFW